MNRCAHVQRELPLFVGGDLGPPAAAMVAAHLRDCPTCRREAVRLQQSLRRLRSVTVPAVDEQWFASMAAAIDDRLAAEAAAGPSRSPVAVSRWWWSAAAALLLFAVGWWLVRPPAPAVFGRAPIAIPVGHPGPGHAGGALVAPYAGERISLRPLGDDESMRGSWADSGQAPGMLGRWRLRALVDEPFEMPPASGDPAVDADSPVAPSVLQPSRSASPK